MGATGVQRYLLKGSQHCSVGLHVPVSALGGGGGNNPPWRTCYLNVQHAVLLVVLL